jgi:phosphatidylglycerophosphate synthase
MKIKDLFIIDYSASRESNFTYFDRYVFRPLGIMIVFFCYKIFRVTPNQLTLISVVFAAVGGIALINDFIFVSCLAYLTFPILDCADGTLARYLRTKDVKNQVGELTDAMGGYLFIAIFWSALQYHMISTPIIPMICNLICIINLICRLYRNKKKSSYLEIMSDRQNNERSSSLYFLYENVEFGSALIPIFILSIYFEYLYVFVYFYFMISLALVLWCIFDYLKVSGCR